MLKFIAIGVIIIFVLGTWLTEVKLNNDSDDFRCYRRLEFKKKVADGLCPGFDKSCKHCVFKKNYDKEIKKEN